MRGPREMAHPAARSAPVADATQRLPESSLSTWSRPLEVDRLAEGEAEVEFAGAIAELPGLRELRPGAAGSVRGRVRFSREHGLAVGELSVKGGAMLECQRCLQPMELPIDVSARLALMASEGDSARVPEELEPVLTPGGRTTIGALVAEELLLTLPIVPLHEGDAGCERAASSATPSRASETHRPFAGLAELLKR